MTIEQAGVLGAILTALISAGVQVRRWWRERAEQRQLTLLNEAHSDEKRQTIIVASAEQAVAVLDDALKAARAEVDRRDERIARLESDNEALRDKVYAFSERVRRLEYELSGLREELDRVHRQLPPKP